VAASCGGVSPFGQDRVVEDVGTPVYLEPHREQPACPDPRFDFSEQTRQVVFVRIEQDTDHRGVIASFHPGEARRRELREQLRRAGPRRNFEEHDLVE